MSLIPTTNLPGGIVRRSVSNIGEQRSPYDYRDVGMGGRGSVAQSEDNKPLRRHSPDLFGDGHPAAGYTL